MANMKQLRQNEKALKNDAIVAAAVKAAADQPNKSFKSVGSGAKSVFAYEKKA